MRKVYIYYILLLLLVFFSAIIVWPDCWVNVDIGNFHYHKLWEGPSFAQLTLGKLENDLDIELGQDFVGSSTYTFKVNFAIEEQDELASVKDSVSLIRNRLHATSYKESIVNYFMVNGAYFITVKVSGTDEDFSEYKDVIFNKGKLEIWGEKGEEIPTEEELPVDFETDPFKAYLSQQYRMLNVDGNAMKGYTIGTEDDTYYLKVVLQDEQATNFAVEVYSYYGKSIIGVLDSFMLGLDGTDLGEQIQLYRQARSVKFAGLPDHEIANMYGAIIQNGPLQIELEPTGEVEFQEGLGKGFIKKGIIVGIGVLSVMFVMFMITFKRNSLLAFFNLGLFVLFTLALVKFLPIKFTVGSMLAFILSLSIFIGLLFKILKDVKERQKEEVIQANTFVNSKVGKLIQNLALIQVITSISFMFFAPWSIKYFMWIIFISAVTMWFVLDQLIPFTYKAFNLSFRNFNN
jgi:preprotein translocase subunit SecD